MRQGGRVGGWVDRVARLHLRGRWLASAPHRLRSRCQASLERPMASIPLPRCARNCNPKPNPYPSPAHPSSRVTWRHRCLSGARVMSAGANGLTSEDGGEVGRMGGRGGASGAGGTYGKEKAHLLQPPRLEGGRRPEVGVGDGGGVPVHRNVVITTLRRGRGGGGSDTGQPPLGQADTESRDRHGQGTVRTASPGLHETSDSSGIIPGSRGRPRRRRGTRLVQPDEVGRLRTQPARKQEDGPTVGRGNAGAAAGGVALAIGALRVHATAQTDQVGGRHASGWSGSAAGSFARARGAKQFSFQFSFGGCLWRRCVAASTCSCSQTL